MGIIYYLGGKVYDYLDEYFEKTRYKKIRKKLLSPLKGKILDAGCGTGRNFLYFNSKTEVIGVDNSSRMLTVAQKRAIQSKARITVKKMDLRNLNFKDDVFDAIVTTFVLCVMSDKDARASFEELIRVAKPGAKIYLLEYVYSKNKYRRIMMKLTAVLPRILYNLRFDSTLPVIKEENGVRIKKLQFIYKDILRLIVVEKKNR